MSKALALTYTRDAMIGLFCGAAATWLLLAEPAYPCGGSCHADGFSSGGSSWSGAYGSYRYRAYLERRRAVALGGMSIGGRQRATNSYINP